MSEDAELIARLRDTELRSNWGIRLAAADRLEALSKENDRLQTRLQSMHKDEVARRMSDVGPHGYFEPPDAADAPTYPGQGTEIVKEVWQCRDFADGWIDFPSYDEASAYAKETDAVMRMKPAAAQDEVPKP